RPTQTIQPDGVSTSQTYDTNGQVDTQKDTAGNVTTIQYYAQTELGAGQPKLVTNPDSTTTLYQYDTLGNMTREWGSGTYPVDYEYNTKGQRTKMFTYRSLASVGNKSQGDATIWGYDAATGLLVSKTDAASKATTYTYYPTGQLKTRSWARGVTSTYGYNTAGDLTSVSYSDSTPGMTQTVGRSGPTQITDGSGTRTFTNSTIGLSFGSSYNAGLLNGLGVSYTYDGLGRLDSMTAGGRTTNYGYRSEGRLGTVTHQSNVATYGYKPNSDLISTTTFTAGAGTRLTSTRNYDPFDRMGSVVNTPGSGTGISRAYTYNNRNQRATSTTASGDYWNYGYNNKGEVTSGVKRNSSNVDLLGHSYAYTFDEIGNRMTTTVNGKASTYDVNALNQYDQRTIPPFAELLGSANPNATVTVNNQPVQRQSDLFFTQIPADNSAGAVYLQNMIVGVRNNADANGNDTVQQGNVKKIVPRTPEVFTYDFDGNVLSDGRFNYTWDGENRLVKAESLSSVPATEKKQILFVYDGQSRRVSKKVNTWNGSAWILADSRRFLYDQFNLLAEVNDSGAVIASYAWGMDLSGSMYGAGGVGGLVIAANLSTVESPAYDANGNILAYVSNSGTVTAQFEYGPFGELIRSSGTAPCNFGFSTKYRDGETGLNYYGYRYYSAGLGRWLGRDRIGEKGGKNLYGFCKNKSINQIDVNGDWATDVHHRIVDQWLPADTYENYQWRCFKIKVSQNLKDGSDFVDGDGSTNFFNWSKFAAAQSSANAYQHAMTAYNQDKWQAEMLYASFVRSHVQQAMQLASQARATEHSDPKGKELMEKAVLELGKAFHSVSDSLSPAHAGFQVWWGPIDGESAFGSSDYYNPWSPYAYIQYHESRETMGVYNGMSGGVTAFIRGYFGGDLSEMLKED
ncbi:MAG: RHS repeat-associated core domain-containing protein, partial [Verrucomicrobiota bacterium]